MGETKDFARGYTFYIQMSPPGGGMGSSPLMYYVRSSNLPASTIEQATTSWQGNAYKVGTTQTFEDFTVTFNVDIDDAVHKTMTAWTHLVHNANTNQQASPTQYMSDIVVDHLDHQSGGTINRYTLHEAWPTAVGQMALAYDAKDLAQFEVTFAYQYHDIAGVTG
jgi:hypothetical protein